MISHFRNCTACAQFETADKIDDKSVFLLCMYQTVLNYRVNKSDSKNPKLIWSVTISLEGPFQ